MLPPIMICFYSDCRYTDWLSDDILSAIVSTDIFQSVIMSRKGRVKQCDQKIEKCRPNFGKVAKKVADTKKTNTYIKPLLKL